MKSEVHTKSREIMQDTLIVGVDIGSQEHAAYITTISGKKLGSLNFANNRRGFEEFWAAITKAKWNSCCRDILLGFESTGTYGEPLQHYLLEKPVNLVQVNPMHTKKTKDICDNTPLKSDEKDSQVITDIIKLGKWISVVVPKGDKAILRRLSHTRERLVRDRTAHYNRLRQQYGLIFPEFSSIIKDIKCKTAQYLLSKYPTPDDYGFLSAEELSKEVRKISFGRFGMKQALALLEAANSSIFIKQGFYGILFEIKQILKQLEYTNSFIAEVEAEIKVTLARVPDSKEIMKIPGLKAITVAAVIGEIGDFSAFRTTKEVQKFAGLNLYEISSGLHKGQVHITKVGRSLLRKTLYFAALNTVRKGGIMHDYYKRLIDKGKPKTKAIIAMSRKLLRIIFAIVRDNSMFIENYHETKIMKKAA